MPRYRSNSNVSLLDIKVKSPETGVVVLMGSPEVASSVYLGGSIILNLNDSMTVKRLSLKFYAILHSSWREPSSHRLMKHEKILFEYDWDSNKLLSRALLNSTPSNINKTLSDLSTVNNKHLSSATEASSVSNTAQNGNSIDIASHNPIVPVIPAGSSQKYDHTRPTSNNTRSSSFTLNPSINLNGTNNSHFLQNYTFPAGNHEIPFEVILPGDIPESIEGSGKGTIIYKLFVTIERPRLFQNSLVKKKQIRVIRTLTPDEEELGKTVAVQNIWPTKIEYEISIPSIAVAIGSTTPVSILLIPLLKGLRLDCIKITLLEYTTLMAGRAPPKTEEIVCLTHTICKSSTPTNSAYTEWLGNDDNYDTEYDFSKDKWDIDALIPIPSDLKICRQDCYLQKCIRISHKLKVSIMLANVGHNSELRVTLPIRLFISPMVPLATVLTPADIENDSDVYAPTLSSTHSNLTPPTIFSQMTPTLSAFNECSPRTSYSGPATTASSIFSVQVTAPPNYQDHIYDTLFSDIPSSPKDTSSLSSTPRTLSSSGSLNVSIIDRIPAEGEIPISASHYIPHYTKSPTLPSAESHKLTNSHSPIIRQGSFMPDSVINPLPNSPAIRSPLRMSSLPDELDSPTIPGDHNIPIESIPDSEGNRISIFSNEIDKANSPAEVDKFHPGNTLYLRVPSYCKATGTDHQLDEFNSTASPLLAGSNSQLSLDHSHYSLSSGTPFSSNGLFIPDTKHNASGVTELQALKNSNSLSRRFHPDDSREPSHYSSLSRLESPEGDCESVSSVSKERIPRNSSTIKLGHLSHGISSLLGRTNHGKGHLKS